MRTNRLHIACVGLTAALTLGHGPVAVASTDQPTRDPHAARIALLAGANGTATFCLTPAAAADFTEAGITISAQAPAEIVSDPVTDEPCFTESNLHASLTLDLTAGEFQMPGAMLFTRASDGSTLTIRDLSIAFGFPSTIAGTVANGPSPTAIEFAWFNVDPLHIQVDPLAGAIAATDTPVLLGAQAADAFARTFGASPLSAGSEIFVGSGSGDISIPLFSRLAVP
jgi:hypothetical protein